MSDIEKLQKEIETIKTRNRNVELEKAWETSTVRKISIAVLTYVVMVIVMLSLRIDKPFVAALIPTLGFTLSTMSLGLVKKYWLDKLGE